MNRLPEPYGLLIDRTRPVHFSFTGKNYQAYVGDSLATALAASGQWLLSRSFKYHRARGIYSLNGCEANTLVQHDKEPNVWAEYLLVHDGLKAQAQNYAGSLEKDRYSFMGTLSRFMPVGFYYHAFFKPRGAWRFWEPLVRAMAGLGTVSRDARREYVDKQFLFCDVGIIGGGLAGMQAALTAARQGKEVLLVEKDPILGGALNYQYSCAEQKKKSQRLCADLIGKIGAADNITVMTDTLCNGWYTDNWLPLYKNNRLYKLRADKLMVCAGRYEQPPVFRNNDAPGIMLCSAAQRLMHLYAIKPGSVAVVFGCTWESWQCALDLHNAGVAVRAIVDIRSRRDEIAIVKMVRNAGIEIYDRSAVKQALLASDKNHIRAVEIAPVVASGELGPRGQMVGCDLLCVSGGFVPTWQLPCQAGAQLRFAEHAHRFYLAGLPMHMRIAGSIAGDTERDAVISNASVQMEALLSDAAWTDPDPAAMEESTEDCYCIFPHPKGKDFVDFDEDLQVRDIVDASRSSYTDIQLVKRYSTLGMGPAQGRLGSTNAAMLLAKAQGCTVDQIGITTARPPFSPERLEPLAGRSFYPERRSAMHRRHVEAGAQFLIAGAWLRPAYYGSAERKVDLVQKESLHVRSKVGIVDISTLGGLEVRGPDAAEFLNRIYTFAFIKQSVGKIRYLVMTNEQGVVIDDGVACRLAEDHFYVTATSTGVDAVYASMLHWNVQWQLKVDIANVSAAYSAINIAGPLSREVLQKICDVDLCAEKFPYLGVCEGKVADMPARLLRVGFVGELGYEVHVPHYCGEALWDVLMVAGREHGIRPFGIETQRLLRLEKGHIIIGQDTDAMTTPAEAGVGWAIARKKPFFVGSRTIRELDRRPPLRRLCGFRLNDPDDPVPEESHLLVEDDKIIGRVTSCYYSPTLEATIGLAYVDAIHAELGNRVAIAVATEPGAVKKRVYATLAETPFYDPLGKCQRM